MLTPEQSKILEDYGERTGEEVDPAVAANALEEIRGAAASGVPETVSFGAEIDAEWLEPLVLEDPVITEQLGASVTIPTHQGAGDGFSVDVSPSSPEVVGSVDPPTDGDLAQDEEALEAAKQQELVRQQMEEAREREARLEEVEEKGDEFLAERYRFAEQCYLLDNLTTLAETHIRSQTMVTDARSYGVLPRYKYNKVHLLEGAGSTMLNKLKFRPRSDELLDATTAELSNLIPMIKLFKVIYSGTVQEQGEVDYEIPFEFLSHALSDSTLKSGIDRGDQKYLQPGSGRTGVGIKSFDWEYISTNPDTIRNDIKAKLVLYFQSFNDLIVCRNATTPDGDQVRYRYLDLIVNAGGAGVCDEEAPTEGDNEADVPDVVGCGRQQTHYDASYYEIRAVVGWAANNADELSQDLRKSISANQTALYLTLEEHEFGINQDGTFTLTINYRGRLEGILSSPKANVLNPSLDPSDPHMASATAQLHKVQMQIQELKDSKICAEDEAYNEKISELKKEKLRLEDELRNLSYKKFAKALDNPGGRYNDFPMTAGHPGDGSERSGIGRGDDSWDQYSMPLLYSIAVPRENIERFVTLGTGQTTPGAEAGGEGTQVEAPEVVASRRQPNRDGNAIREMEDTIADEPEEEGFDSAAEGSAKYSLKDYSILDNFEPDGGFGDSFDILNFFYLGDLIDIVATDVFNNTFENWLEGSTAIGTMIYQGGADATKHAVQAARDNAFQQKEVENLRVLLGPFEYIDPLRPGTIRRINIADIPISFRMFIDFCQRKIIRKRRQTYPFMEFIRDMVQDLVVRALGAECFGKNGARGIRIKTAFVEGPATERSDGSIGDPIQSKALENIAAEYQGIAGAAGSEDTGLQSLMSNTTRLDMDKYHTGQPFFDYTRSQQVKDTYQYLFIFAEGPAGLIHPSFANPEDEMAPEDRDRLVKGIHHLHIGRDRGLVKTIEFSKTDVPGLREARVEKSGTFDPIAQLSDVYEVTITLFGNTFFYPGSYVYINPFGLGSHQKGGLSKLGYPWERNSLSNIMGLGGYHIIINVSNYIEAGKFETTIKARFDASGDGCKVTAAESENDTDCPESEVEVVGSAAPTALPASRPAPAPTTPPVGSESGPDLPGR